MKRKSNGSSYGGHMSEMPENPEMKFGPDSEEKRRVVVTSRVFGINQLGNGHHHATIKEEDNCYWDEKEQMWREPWQPDMDKDMEGYKKHQALFEGRTEWNSDYVYSIDVVKWAKEVIKSWGATEDTHIIEWDLDEDDPIAVHMYEIEQREKKDKPPEPQIEAHGGLIPPRRRFNDDILSD